MFAAAGYAWDPLAPAYLLAALATFGLGAGVLLYERFTVTSRQFFRLTTITAAWLAPLAGALLATDDGVRHAWLRIAFVADPFTAPAMYRLGLGLAGIQRPRFRRMTFLGGAGFSALNILTPWLVDGLDAVTQRHTLHGWGWVGMLYFLFISAILISVLWELTLHRQRTQTSEDRRESLLLTMAAGIASLTLVDYWTPSEPFRTGVLTPAVILTALAIGAVVATRYRVFSLMQAFGTDEVLRAMSDAVLVCDSDGIVRGANRAGEQLTGRPLRELVGAPVSDLLVQRASRREPWRPSAGTGERDLELALVSDGREAVAVRVSTEPLVMGGRAIGSVVVARDVRDRLETERALQAALLRYRALYNRHPALVFELDTEGRIVSLNPAGRRLLGISEDAAAAGINWADRIHPEDLGAMRGVLARAIAGASEAFEARLRARARRYREVRGFVVPVRDGEEVVGLFGVGLDVTHEIRAQRELEVQRRYFADLFEGSPEGIVLVEAEGGRVRRVNQEFTRLFGYTATEALGRELDRLIVPAPLVGESQELNRAAATGGVVRAETVRHRKDGSAVDVSVLARRLEIPGEPPQLYGIYRDITVRKRTERALREREEELRHAQKLEAVGKLAGGIAHDFNNLLTVINGHARLGIESMPAGSAVAADLVEIEKAGTRAAALTQQLLAYSRRQVLRPQVLDLVVVVRDVQGMLQRLIGEHIRLEARFDTHPLRVRADRGQLEQVLVNLVVNARDAMPDGGVLTLETEPVELDADDPRLSQWELRPGRFARVRVADTGAGMDPDTLERAFEPFFTTKEPGKGTGLGLSTVFGIIKQSGGHVTLSSTPGSGTVCAVLLPLATSAAPASEETVEPGDAERCPGGSVLLVEDEAAVRDLAARVLRRAGCEVMVAANGVEALALVDRHHADLDLVLTDLVMPEMGGRDLYRALQAAGRDVPVLFMSGYDADGVDGAEEDAFLSKPFTPQTLVRRVAEALGRADTWKDGSGAIG